MIERFHAAAGTRSQALYSNCECYRYALSREWEPDGAQLLYIMLNPSKATETQNDPTIERCERRARRLGFGGFAVANLFAWRETDPKALRAAPAPVGEDNDAVLMDLAAKASHTLAAWGVHGAHLGRAEAVARLLLDAGVALSCLGQTKEGHPRHPLYVSYQTSLRPWPGPSVLPRHPRQPGEVPRARPLVPGGETL